MTIRFTDRRKFLATAAAGVSLAACATPSATANTVARTQYGRVAGFARNGAQIFLGLPYGAPTGGANRFLPPKPPAAWSDIRDATRFAERSPQNGPAMYDIASIGPYMCGGRQAELQAMREPMGEDCLNLNVLTPAADRARRPVLIYFHGGGFESGSGATMTLADRAVVEHDFVYVTVTHRLNAFGFTDLRGIDPRFEFANVGILDLVAALQWVRDNIENFGGDPDKVTISGESGGGSKVAALMAMPQARGLFRAAIIESGGPPSPSSPEAAAEAIREFMAARGVSGVDALLALSMQDALTLPVRGPVADDRTLPANIWSSVPSAAAGLPLLIGYCATEETVFADASAPAIDAANLSARLASVTNLTEAQIAPALAAYRALYPSDSAYRLYYRMQTLSRFWRRAFDMADLMTTQAPPVFMYRFEYDVGFNNLESFHTAELPLSMRMVLNPDAEDLSRRMCAAWANFVRHGDPGGAGAPAWPRYEPNAQPMMLFGRDPTPAGPDPEAQARRLWLSILDNRQ